MTVNSQSGPRSPRPPDDLITTATSALRRLHFKTGRHAGKNNKQQTVPKVIVMGSSTASETTINTSTDSANTIVTTMTNTDGEATEDSMDVEPLDILISDNITDNGKHKQILQPVPASPLTPLTAKQQTPITAKQEIKFTFDLMPEKNNSLVNKSVDRFMEEQVEALKCDARRRNSYKAAQEDYNKMEYEINKKSDVIEKYLETPKIKQEKSSPKRRVTRTSSSSPEEGSPKVKHRHKKSTRRHHSPNKRDKFIYDEKQIAKYHDKGLPDLRVDFFSETMENCQNLEKRGSVCLNKCLREVGTQLETVSPINVTTNPLDNSVHFGSSNRKVSQATTIVIQQPSLSLDQTNVTTILLKNGSEFISNVESAGSGGGGGGCVGGGGVGAGSGGVIGSGTGSGTCNIPLSKLAFKRKEDNMKQLLDVANNLTLEEIHDFEMRYGSPHHNRSQSVKTPGRSSGRPNYLCLPQQRSRVASMPNTGVEEEYYRLRHFSITGKGVVNRGDSLKSRRSRSNNSVASSNSSTEQLPGVGSARTSASCSLASSRESSTSAPGPNPYRVLMLGGPAVGKSSLVSQFMTSEYLHAYDTSIDDESGEKSVSVLLAGEESELTFIDFSTSDLSPDSCVSKYSDPHAYCVVYSSSDRLSLVCAEKILQTLWTLDTISTRAVILVANKADLVRSKVVSTEEGKSMATAYDCKFIETSVGINHNVDELLVGILTQIRLKLENPERSRDLFRKRSSSKKNFTRNKSPGGSGGGGGGGGGVGSGGVGGGVGGGISSILGTPLGSAQNSPKKYRGSRTSASLKVRSLLGKVWARDSKSKSCENLHVL